MANFYSTQRANTVANPPVMNPSRDVGKPFRVWFDYTTPASGMPAVGDTIELVTLPSGARIVGGVAWAEAMSTGAGTAGFDVGYSGAANRYGAAKNVDAAAKVTFADTIAENAGDVLTAERTIIATVTGEQWAANRKFYGYIDVLFN